MSFFAKLGGSSEDRLQSITRNLEAVFNAQRGYAAAVEVFGLGNYDAHDATAALLKTLAGEMLDAVRVFEPRIVDPSLSVLGRDGALWLRMTLSGLVGGKVCHFQLRFHSVTRQVRVLCG